jgi:pimeloyl-ACP methyl ester carboxylesterase
VPGHLPAGPYRMLELDDGTLAPWYIIPFDKKGRCDGPATRDHLVATARNGSPTDVFIFSHGWNNDWQWASKTYNRFLEGYQDLRRSHHLRDPEPYRPLLVGIFWPSTALVMPWEKAPKIAGPIPEADETDREVAQERREVQEIAEDLGEADVETFYSLAQHEGELGRDEALVLARILAPLYRRGDLDIAVSEAEVSAEELVEVWEETAEAAAPEPEFDGKIRSLRGRAEDGESLLSRLDPRNLIRLATVRQMKDRAGTVGASGVSRLLTELQKAAPDAWFHLVGHSYGCKVLLSAICYLGLPRPVKSLLLLQPAVSHLCFAADATGNGQPGGYHAALKLVEQPILTTYSANDDPLTHWFHRALWRKADLGEARIAAPETPPSVFAALGGFGPGGCDALCERIDIKTVPDYYDLDPKGPRIYALNGDQYIGDHGDISNEATWWALYNQVAWDRVPRPAAGENP